MLVNIRGNFYFFLYDLSGVKRMTAFSFVATNRASMDGSACMEFVFLGTF